jgi:arylsulfatase A-like enzyme/uncharacterized membrane protein YbhN (UPF0104 family)
MKKVVFFGIKLCFISFVFLFIFNPQLVFRLLPFLSKFISPDKFKGFSLHELGDVLTNLDPMAALFWLTFALVAKLLGICAGVIRWKLLLRGQGMNIPFWYLAKCWFMGRAIGLLLPGTVGLDGYRLVESSAYTGEVIKCTTVIAVEKLIGFIAIGLLVFLTLPIGASMFDFKPAVLGILLTGILGFITTSFLLLLNPRIVQVLAAVLPTPQFIRNKVDKLGAAVTAYSAHRATLLGAVLLGLCVHLGIIFMYFGTTMAIMNDTSVLLSVLFVSPLIIVGGILAPTVSGVGVREGVFTTVLGAKFGSAQAFMSGHLGMWAGELVPFALSIPLLLFATRPDREKFLAELAEVRAESSAHGDDGVTHLAPAVVAAYREAVFKCVVAGLAGGLIGGAIVGLVEAMWHMSLPQVYEEVTAYMWAPTVYGIVFSGMGLGIVAGLLFLYLLFDRFASAAITFGLALGGTIAALTFVFGRFRFQRDVLGEHALSMAQNLQVVGAALVIGLVAAVIGAIVVTFVKGSYVRGLVAGVAGYILVVLVGAGLMSANKPTDESVAFTPPVASSSPNIIFIAVDTLRADYLKVFNPDAAPETPKVSAFADDSIRFTKTFAQSSWTKASFGTMFSGQYPEAHTATGKVSSLPDEIVTYAEMLQAGGYYTKGFSNNPNITSSFNYDQGFADYVDLEPSLYFKAQPSSKKLVLYDILRKVVNVVYKRMGNRISITDFYQPGDVVTGHGLDWIDSAERPADAPFLLFLHYMDPHDPFRDPDRPGKGYARVQLGDQPNITDELIGNLQRAYTYEVEAMDEAVGALLDGLRERGLYDDTLIIFTADHGEEFGEHGGLWHGLSLYDEQIAVPLIIKAPGNENGGLENPFFARHVDLAPTMAQFAGLTPPDRWQGKSLFTDDLSPGNMDVGHVYMHLDFDQMDMRALRTETDKLIRGREDNKRGYDPVELYDLIADPGEQNNLAGEEESLTRIGEIDGVIADMQKFIIENQAEPSLSTEGMEDQMEALEALGYLGD